MSKLAREEGGRTKLIKYGRYLTVLLCIGQGFFMATQWENPATIFAGLSGSLVSLYGASLHLVVSDSNRDHPDHRHDAADVAG